MINTLFLHMSNFDENAPKTGFRTMKWSSCSSHVNEETYGFNSPCSNLELIMNIFLNDQHIFYTCQILMKMHRKSDSGQWNEAHPNLELIINIFLNDQHFFTHVKFWWKCSENRSQIYALIDFLTWWCVCSTSSRAVTRLTVYRAFRIPAMRQIGRFVCPAYSF